MIVQTNIIADVARANLFNPLIIAEDDENSHVLLAQLAVNGELLDFPSTGFDVALCYQRADDTYGTASGSILSGKVRIALPDAMFVLDDMVVCDIRVNRQVVRTNHELSVSDGDIVVTTVSGTYDSPLKTGLFYIDSQLRVITD